MSKERIEGIISREDGEQLQYNSGYSDALASVMSILHLLQQQITDLITKHPGNELLEEVIIHLANSLMVVADCWNECNTNNNAILEKLKKDYSVEYDEETEGLAYQDGKLLVVDFEDNKEDE